MLWRRRFSCESDDDLVEPTFTLNRNLDDPKLQEYEKRIPTFEQIPPFDKKADYLHHIKLGFEEMKEDIRQWLITMGSQRWVSKEKLDEELKNFASQEDLAKLELNIEDLKKKYDDLRLKAEEPFTVLMCGETGSGKSTLSTIMTGNECKEFKVSRDSSNKTTWCVNNGKDGHPFLGKWGSGRKIRIIDTPGLGNYEDSDDDEDDADTLRDDAVARKLRDYLGKPHIYSNDKISALLWIEDANSFYESGADERVERYIKLISPKAMEIIIMIFNKDESNGGELATLKESFKNALLTAAQNQFQTLSEDQLNQCIDNIPCILLKKCDGLDEADQVMDEVFEKFIGDNEEQLEKLLQCVEKNHADARAISSYDVIDKSNQDLN